MHVKFRRETPRKKLSKWHLHELLRKFDTFGKPLPSFNLQGEQVVHTMTGGILTFVISVVLLIYAVIKLIQMVDQENPNISSLLDKSVFDFNEQIGLNEIDFRLAFSVEGYHSR